MKQTQKIILSEPDFQLIGIASHENDYRVAWAINTVLQTALAKSQDITVFHDKYNQDITISVFSQDFADQGYTFKLFANRGDNFFLLEDLRNIDFFLKIEGEITSQKMLNIVSALKTIDIVMGVYQIDIKNIRKIQRLHF
jgi:hypothetical protein